MSRHQIHGLPFPRRRLKSEHLKKRGDRALQEGDCRLAWEKYSEAIDAKADKEGLHMLYSNRSLAFSKAQRHADALSDADTAIRLAPKWGKAHWRRGMALLGLCDTPGAVLAFLSAWQLAKDDSAECERKLRQVVHQLKREELGAGFLHLFGQLQEQGAMRGAEVEAANEQELVEAWFRVITAAHRGQPRPGPLYHTYLTSLKQGLDPAEAYTLRSAVCAKAKCYLQARADAQAAVTLLGNALRQDPQHPDAAKRQAERAGVELLKQRMGRAYLRLGEAFLAEPDHEDRDAVAAFKALTRGSGACRWQNKSHSSLPAVHHSPLLVLGLQMCAPQTRKHTTGCRKPARHSPRSSWSELRSRCTMKGCRGQGRPLWAAPPPPPCGQARGPFELSCN